MEPFGKIFLLNHITAETFVNTPYKNKNIDIVISIALLGIHHTCTVGQTNSPVNSIQTWCYKIKKNQYHIDDPALSIMRISFSLFINIRNCLYQAPTDDEECAEISHAGTLLQSQPHLHFRPSRVG